MAAMTQPPPRRARFFKNNALVVAACGPMQAWAPTEVEAGQAIQRILATQFVDDAEVLRQIDESRPRIQRHIHALRAYEPRTADVRAIHREYLDAWVDLLRGYAEIEHGLRDGDPRALAAGRTALLEWRRGLRSVARDLRDLADLAHADASQRRGPV
jgi:hypothetical protein